MRHFPILDLGGRGGLGFPFILSKIVGSVQCWPTDHACRCIFLVFKGFVFVCSRAMIKGQGGQVFLSGYYELDPWLLSKNKQKKNRTKRNHQLFDLSPIWTRRKCGSLDHGHQGVKMRLEKTREGRKIIFYLPCPFCFLTPIQVLSYVEFNMVVT